MVHWCTLDPRPNLFKVNNFRKIHRRDSRNSRRVNYENYQVGILIVGCILLTPSLTVSVCRFVPVSSLTFESRDNPRFGDQE